MVLRLTFRLRMCRQMHLTRDFSRTLSLRAHTTLWLKVSLVRIHSICMSSMMSHVWACIVCSRFVFFLSLAPPLALHWLPVLCRAHQLPQCRIRRGLNPVRTRTMRSVAPCAMHNRLTAWCTTEKTFTTCSSSRTVPIRQRIWIDIEPGAQSDQAYPVAKRQNTLLRHGQVPREEDGAIEFWRVKDDLRNKFE